MHGMSTLLTFSIGSYHFGFDINDILRVERVKQESIYTIPKSSSEVLGMYRDSNDVFPLFDLNQLLKNGDYDTNQISDENFNVVKVKLKGITAGLCFDGNVEFIDIEDDEVPLSSDPFIKKQVEHNEKDLLIIDIQALFPNIKMVGTTLQRDEEEDDLDLSQYVLEE